MLKNDWSFTKGWQTFLGAVKIKIDTVLQVPEEFSFSFVGSGHLVNVSIFHNQLLELFRCWLKLLSHNECKCFSFEVKVDYRLVELLVPKQSVWAKTDIHKFVLE